MNRVIECYATCLLILVLVFARFYFLNQRSAITPPIDVVSSQPVQHQVFDPDAVVVMLVGDDGAPGVAGVDDNANGVADDRSELGASRSDDVCTVMSQAALSRVQEHEAALVLQRGAFIDAPKSSSQSFAASRTIMLSPEGSFVRDDLR